MSKTAEVTPCMGVWIETACQVLKVYEPLGHTLYGCVDSIEDL